MDGNRIAEFIEDGLAVLGIELGSTRIKAVLIGDDKMPIESGSFSWENANQDGVWTYSLDDALRGLAASYASLRDAVLKNYGVKIKKLKAFGISAMMHGYIALDKEDNLLTPFRTWRNNITAAEAEELTALFEYNIPQRWTSAHLTKDIEENKKYLDNLNYITTLSGYIHYMLTGRKVIGIGDASGMFPIDIEKKDYLERAINSYQRDYVDGRYSWNLMDILPKILLAGNEAGCLTKKGAVILDDKGWLCDGIPMCPPEGDAGTGMVATDSILPRTGNVSAGTSAFAMVVLEKPLSKVYSSLDIVTTPDGSPVAMAHSNNCTGSYDAWVSLFHEAIKSAGFEINKGKLYDILLNKALDGNPACNGLLSYCYISGEHVTGFSEGRPLFVRKPDVPLNLSDFMRSELYSSLCAMRIGLDVLFDSENVKVDLLCGHGGFFKSEKPGMMVLSAAVKIPVRVLDTAGEGGAWGIALLADYMSYRNIKLGDYLDDKVFCNASYRVFDASEEDKKGFDMYLDRYKRGLEIERCAVKCL